MRTFIDLKAIFQTDSGKKKVTFHNGRPPWCASKLLMHLFLSSTAAFGMTKLASPQLNLISSLIKSRATAGEATISVSKQQHIGMSSGCMVEQEIIVLLLLSWPSPFLSTDSCGKAFIILSRCLLALTWFWNWVPSLSCVIQSVQICN